MALAFAAHLIREPNMQGEPFEVGPYECIPESSLPADSIPECTGHARELPKGLHTAGALIRRKVGDRLLEARVTFDEEGFHAPDEAVAYAAARADYLLRIKPSGLVSF
jgi:hypothetical protein